MNSLWLIVGCIGLATMGFAAYIHFIAGINLLTVMQEAVNQLPAVTSTVRDYLTRALQNPTLVLSALGGLATFAGFAYQAYSNVKQRKQEAEELLQATQVQTNSHIQSLEQQLDQKDAQLTALASQRPDVTPYLAQIEALKSSNADIQRRYAEAQNMLKVIRSPDVPEMMRRLQQEGYTVKETIK